MKLAASLALLAIALATPAAALVKYDEGGLIIEGVQLLQDANDANSYYYLPQYPRLATKEDGETLEFLCLKYVGDQGKPSGGMFHALVEFSLPPKKVAEIQAKLEQQQAGAKLRGPVPLQEATEQGRDGLGAFRVVSATLGDTGEGGFTRKLITSGKAPLAPGSKAVVAAMLNQEGATLLWDTFNQPTSDVSVSITAYYEAAVKAYNAKVSANMDVIYEHFSRVANVQKGYTKREMRSVTDELVRSGGITIEVVDRSKSLGLDAGAMQGIVDIITTKLTELMFDADAGWAKAPEKEVAVEGGQIPGRQERGGFTKWFAGTGDQEYVTDNQYVLKRRKDITRNSFSLNLSLSSTIRVPFDSSGNLGGIYADFKDDPRYFRVVNLRDTAFEKRQVYFQVDGNYLDSFQDTINFVSVNFRKTYKDQPAYTSSLVFTHEDIKNGRTMKPIEYARLGAVDQDWRGYEYQVRWSVRDRPTVGVPAKDDQWIATEDPAVSLVPPFERRIVDIDSDPALLKQAGIVTAVVEFATPLVGKPQLQRKATLRATDPDLRKTVSVYHDRDKPIGWRVTWYSRKGTQRGTPAGLDGDYLLVLPPEPTADGAAPAGDTPAKP
jgi:hypothetical protein